MAPNGGSAEQIPVQPVSSDHTGERRTPLISEESGKAATRSGSIGRAADAWRTADGASVQPPSMWRAWWCCAART
jgi:hypothetical protein